MSSSRWLVVLCLTLSGCSKDRIPEPEPTSPGPESASSQAKEAAHQAPSAPHAGHPMASSPGASEVAIDWTVPDGWTESPNKSPMRKASYVIPDPSGGKETAELAVFFFGPQQGGDVKQNITRWVNQFKDVPDDGIVESERQANGLEQHVVEIKSGTFVDTMMGGGAKSEQGMLGAVVVAPDGNKYFFKMTGPAKTVQSSKDAFDALLQSMKTKS